MVIRQRTRKRSTIARDCGEETVVAVTGLATQNPAAPGGMELTEPRITPLTKPAQTPPVELWRPRWRPRCRRCSTTPWSAGAIRPGAPSGSSPPRRCTPSGRLDGRGFTEIQSPKLVAGATEGGANVFAVAYFGGRVLAQSPQLYKQTMVGVFERVYGWGRCSAPNRTTPSATWPSTRLDAELGFIRDHPDVWPSCGTRLPR